MTVTLSWEALAALAAWASVVLFLIGRLMNKFKALDEKFSQSFQIADDRFNEHVETDTKDHAAVKAQISDIALTASETYMRRREFEVINRDWMALLTELRKDIGGVHTRIDQLIRDGSVHHHRGRD